MKRDQRLSGTIRYTGPGIRIRPLLISLLSALLYVVVCSLYIMISDKIAAQRSTTVSDFARIELYKGLAFVFATGAAYFVIAYLLFRRIGTQEMRILRQEGALAAAEGRAIAGVVASSIAHDMGNLLTALRINLFLLKSELEQANQSDAAAHLLQAVEDLSELVGRLASIGRDRTADQTRVIDLPTVVRKVAAFAPTHVLIRQCTLTTVVNGPLSIRADESLITRTLVNLILNAAEATGKGGRIEVRLGEDGGMAHLEVHDNGPGVPGELRRKIFDPFYTSKKTGTGLGLLSAKVCALEHHGTVSVLDSDLGGACFRISFPLHDNDAQRSPL